jgi:hypothetical protein
MTDTVYNIALIISIILNVILMGVILHFGIVIYKISKERNYLDQRMLKFKDRVDNSPNGCTGVSILDDL